jgi:hypothetical protein
MSTASCAATSRRGDVAVAFEILDRYEYSEPHRVRAATLKRAGGDLRALEYEIESANCDYRDVLGYAEYPEGKRRMLRNLSEDERRGIYERDWRQYEVWCTRV